jgi:hypothetical protein
MGSKLVPLLLPVCVLGGCGSEHAVSPVAAELANELPCNPLQSAELAASLAQPLAVARTRSGVVYAVSQVGSETVVWRSLDEQLIAYRVLQRNSALGATLFGVADGVDGFALTLSPETAPTSVRLFHSLAEALPRDASGTTTAGTELEVLPNEALQGFRAATEISPLRLLGAYVASRGGGRLNEDVLLLRTTVDAPIAVFNRRDGVLRQQRVTDSMTGSDGSLDLQFELYGKLATVHVEGNGLGSMNLAGETIELRLSGLTPLFLSQLEFRCDPSSMPEDWALPEARAPLPAASCPVPGSALRTCLDAPSQTLPVGGGTQELVEALVTEIGTGVPPAGTCSTWRPEGPETPAQLFWAHLEHAGGDAWLGLSTPEAAPPFRVGETLSLRASWGPPSWTQTYEEFELRSAPGDLLLWHARANRFSELRGIPEFEFTLGPERCRSDAANCALDVAQFALDSWRIDGDATLIGSGEQVRQGPFSVQNAGIIRVQGVACADVPDRWLELAVWRSPSD